MSVTTRREYKDVTVSGGVRMETDVAEGSLGTRDGKNIDGKEEINEAR
jgi:hypothetical protein